MRSLLTFRWRDTLPLAYPLFVFVGAELVLILFANVGYAIPATCCAPAGENVTSFGEAAGRMQVITFLAAFALAAGVTIGKLGWDLGWRYRVWAARQFWPYFALALAVGAAIPALMAAGWWPETKTLIGQEAFAIAFRASAQLGSPRFWSEASLAAVVVVFGFAVLGAAALVVFGVVSCLGLPDGYAAMSPEEQKQIWYAQSDRMKLYLYLGAGALTLGVLFMRAWMTYPLFVMQGEALATLRGNFGSVVNSYVGFVGMQFSAMFAVVAVPVLGTLAQRATGIAARIARRDAQLTEPPPANQFNLVVIEAKEKHRLSITRDEVLKVLFPVIAPLVAGWLPGLAHVLV